MATDPAEGAVLRQMVSLARKEPVNFAFCDGGAGGSGPVLLIDRRKPAASLAKEARRLAGGARAAHGEMTAQGSTIRLDCAADLPNLAKLMRTHMKANGISAEVVLGTAEADEAAAEPAEPPTAAAAGVVGLSEARQGWSDARDRVMADVKALLTGVGAATGDQPEYAHAPREMARLVQPVAQMDDRLDALLARLERAQGDDRAALVAAAQKALRNHAALMETEFFKAVDASGFAETRIRATILNALKGVAEALTKAA
ncbi:hypothetical protein SAMN05444007_11280 [Cribrihabitans marinus]|uniref:Uncharacterized protein n=1 Tax=Cribrihabitans marinus TaxID=1227549 RepID=A0A1H7DVV2_9RHOB|nr:hypothetical protein [Cribrihabitans marinus]SEK03440.1 hypothetical protein SAMN05444007_11280 [Cribrihabitans marinus]